MLRVDDQLAASGKLILLTILLTGCTYSGHSIKGSIGREVGQTLVGTEYSIGVEVRYDARRDK